MEWSAPGYTEIKQLGAGAGGRVVLAVHNETGVKVAIKYLSAELLRDDAAVARFQAEARLLTTLRDPHIATMWEYIQDAGGACIVMELVNGVSLRALMRENGTTEPEAALVVLKGSLLGLARAHAFGVVHRDYKPENVLVREDGVSKLVDFGIAVRQGSAGHPEGTPPYMAPELWEGRPASPATDVYAATAVFFECLTGHRPYRSTEPSVLGYQHMYAPVPLHDAPEPVRGLISRGLAKDPARRPESAHAFVAELEATARAAYGEDWEERGRRRLAALVALLALLLPTPPAATPEVSTSFARTVFRGLRSNAARVAMGGGLAAAVAVAAVVVLANRERPPAGPIGAAAAVPPSQVTPELASVTPTTPEATPESSPESSPEGAPETDPPSTPEAVLPEESPTASLAVPPTATDPATTPSATPTRTPAPSATPTRTRTRTPTPTPTRIRTRTPSPTPTPIPTPTPTPTPTVTTPSPITSVLGASVGDLTVNEDGVARATIAVRADGTAPVTATAAWTASGTDGRTERVRLLGSTAYTRTLTWSMGERPCGKTVTLTLTTSPAAPGGPRTASVSVPPCPTRVTGLRVALDVPAAPARAAHARIGVTASGTAEIPVEAQFAVNGDPVGTRTATLSGRTSYTRTLTHAFRSRPCGSTLSVKVTAGGRTATARASVPCPPQVRQVSIVRASAGDGLTATVRVLTSTTQPVRLNVAFSAGEVGDTRSEALSGATSYVRTFTLPVKRLPCGTRWSVTASTDPAAAGGGDTASGTTAECPSEEEPPKSPEPEISEEPNKID
ncbi:serine/threonine-protein kinase [Nonomuraea sp. SYSU D8015]|uniref:serine/threonine-protein kinase n=1 Tax=Nonomuraea sp. SYSU D8015 TaxID=2593644 RepID=UPI0016606453|nr:serine/threonine-protein kinase [Nonomuraea sp. SYSU D8015]